MRDLRFSSEETEEFLKAQLGSIDRREARVLHELTDGWVAGLQLICVDRRRRDGTGRAAGGKDLSHLHVQDAAAFAKYFEDEVLSRLPKAELELLELAAACNRFCASLCAALLGRPAALAEAATVLARIERDNVFILPIEGSDRETWYRLHPLLGEVLRERLKSRGSAELHAIHTVAWVWFRNRGLLDEAVHHAVLAGECIRGGGSAGAVFLRIVHARRPSQADRTDEAIAGRAGSATHRPSALGGALAALCPGIERRRRQHRAAKR